MTDEIKNFLRDKKELIMKGEWTKLLSISSRKFYPNNVGSYLYKSGINFLEDLKFVPYGCFLRSDLKEIELPDSIHSIHSCAFAVGQLTYMHIPANVRVIDDQAFCYCENLKQVTFDENTNLSQLGVGVFKDCKSLEEINLPDSLYTIPKDTFSNCTSLKSVKLPSNLCRMGDNTFMGCTSLRSIELPRFLQDIPENAFSSCENLFKVVIPEGLKFIDKLAFAYSGLDSISIPSSVERIHEHAFANLYSSLDVTYDGTKEDWKEIINPKALVGTSAIIHCTDGDIVKKSR